jgi:hypothetical protein
MVVETGANSSEDREAYVNVFSASPRGYPWPASRLTERDMARLFQIRRATRKPITRLLQDAVMLLWDATEAERIAFDERMAAEERMRVMRQEPQAGNGDGNLSPPVDHASH